MRRYTLLPHTADIRLMLEGDSPEDVFLAGLEGMAAILSEGFCARDHADDIRERISLRGPDMTTLLVDFLSEVLTLTHTQQAIFCGASFHLLDDTELDVTVSGSMTGKFEEDIKAVTYHEADVRQRADGTWESMLVFDI